MLIRTVIPAIVASVLSFSPAMAHAESWSLQNTPGFGNPENTSGAMAIFNGHLYVVTRNLKGSEVWKRRLGGGVWREVTPSWSAATTRALALTVFGDRLYIGTDVGQVWRTAGELTTRPCVPAIFRPGCLPLPSLPRTVELWSHVTPTHKDWPATEITSLAAFGGHLYVAASGPLQIWRAPDGVAWEPIVPDAFGDATNNDSGKFGVFAGQLYAGTSREVPGGTGPADTGLEIWRTGDGVVWEPVVASAGDGTLLPGATLPGGFGFPANATATALVPFRGRLYVSTVNHEDNAQIWRFDGADWEEVTPSDITGPFVSIPRVQTMAVFRSRLFAGRGISPEEATVWATFTGTEWGVTNPDGYGEGMNTSADSMVASSPYFFVLTQDADGVRIWRKAISPLDVVPFERGRCAVFPELCGGPPPIPTD
jgi:hypothetical protein